MLKYILILIIFLSIPSIVIAGDRWSKTEIAMETTFQVLNLMDYRQTIQIPHNPNYGETNWMMGSDPSKATVNYYMGGYALAHLIVSDLLPSRYRKVWQIMTISMASSAVCNNYNLGLKIRF